jgi:MTH538 TIR-like domain (DUF1863).
MKGVNIMAKVYHIFISHSWTYSDAYDRLINLLRSRPYFDFVDYSVPKDDPIHNPSNDSELYEAIRNEMRPCHIVLVMAGVYSTYSRWINKEIRIATKEFLNPKPILAIKPWGNTNVSTVVSQNADRLVSWNTESIVNAIRAIAL